MRHFTVLHSTEEEWRLTLEIQAKGFRAAFHKSMDQGPIVNPAVSVIGQVPSTSPRDSLIPLRPEVLRRILKKDDLTFEGFLKGCEANTEEDNEEF